MSKSNVQTKPATNKPASNKGKPAPTSTAATLAALNNVPPVTSSAAQPVKRPAVVYTSGVAAGAPSNAPAVTLGGQPFNGTLPATNPANRGAVGTVKTPAATLALGNGKQPKSAHGVIMWGAVVAALQAGKGKATAATLASAAGAGGAAFVGYCVKNGWLKPQA